ncbi:hypothetical protein JQS43_19070 [Natronosporangium hydrolyticum]|uniref:Uncharacterized protein n=1 Tax=Natronosporangium hydrolyticum TaxID=2811111 RepID=A0A895YE32_9ACTN|nr:hypothetical protein [Natronosporangium hydrolyticum]QSB13659.1 hypothetical protein JQS43_19070 [Natronosporangium hydrolyticum]
MKANSEETVWAPGRPWRIGVAAGEGLRAALAGRWPAAMMVLLLVWGGILPGAADAAMVAGLVADEQRFLDAGGDVLIVENDRRDGSGPSGVPAAACTALNESATVSAVALTRLPQPAAPRHARGGDVPVFAASGDLWGLLGATASPERHGILPTTLADQLGVADGGWLALEPSPGTLGERLPLAPIRVTVADMSPLGDALTGVLLPTTPVADPIADACVVRTDLATLDTLRATVPAHLQLGADPPTVRDRLWTGEFTADPAADLAQRPLQWAWAATGPLLGLVWLLLRWMRRSEDALYATMGADATSRLVIRGTEWGVIACLGGLWAVTGGVIGALLLSSAFPIALAYVARHTVAALLVATAVVLVGQVRRPRSLLADLKDR